MGKKKEKEQIRFPNLTDEERYLVVAEQILNEHLPAFEKLAKEEYADN